MVIFHTVVMLNYQRVVRFKIIQKPRCIFFCANGWRSIFRLFGRSPRCQVFFVGQFWSIANLSGKLIKNHVTLLLIFLFICHSIPIKMVVWLPHQITITFFNHHEITYKSADIAGHVEVVLTPREGRSSCALSPALASRNEWYRPWL